MEELFLPLICTTKPSGNIFLLPDMEFGRAEGLAPLTALCLLSIDTSQWIFLCSNKNMVFLIFFICMSYICFYEFHEEKDSLNELTKLK